MRIAQISDTHILAAESDDPLSARRADNLRRCVAAINREEPDAVIHTGDSVHQGLPEEYAQLRAILTELIPPVYIVPGNRDSQAGLRAAFPHLPYLPTEGSLLHYAVEEFPVRLVGLDSVEAGERKGVYGADRIAWLNRTLALEPAKPTILFIHHPPFDVAPDYYGGYRRPQEGADLAAAVGAQPQVRQLLCGHVHRFHRENWGGTGATIMPSVAVDLRKGVDSALGEAPLYLLHSIAPGGELVTRARIAVE